MDQVRTRHQAAPVASAEAIAELIAVIVAVTDGEPRVLTIDDGRALPSGPFELTHRSLQAGMRSWVEQQTHHPLGYVEQLYTFADRDRTAVGPADGLDQLSRPDPRGPRRRRARRRLAELVPLSSRGRIGATDNAGLTEAVDARLRAWAAAAGDAPTRRERLARAAITFGQDGRGLERGAGAAALRTALGGRPGGGIAAGCATRSRARR